MNLLRCWLSLFLLGMLLSTNIIIGIIIIILAIITINVIAIVVHVISVASSIGFRLAPVLVGHLAFILILDYKAKRKT